MNNKRFQLLHSIILIIASSLLYSFVVHAFVGPADLMPAGFLGLSRLISLILGKYFAIQVNFLIIYWILQLFLTLLVFKLVGKRFAILTILQYTVVTIIGLFFQDFILTEERLLMVIFAGVLGGIAATLALKAGGSSGGTDFVAIYLQNKNAALPVWDYVMYFNYCILFITGLINGWDSVLFSIVYQTITAMVVSNMDATNKLAALTIITDQVDDVTETLFKNFTRGITVLWGEGAYTRNPKAMLYMTCYQHQVDPIIKIVQQVDNRCFITVTKLEHVQGNFVRTKVK